jgi:formamidopyrimidine-DNA glycosylase
MITAVSVFDDRALTRHLPGAADFVARLEGRTFTGAARRGKFLWLPLDSADSVDSALIAHLGMSGQMLLRAPDAGAERHEHRTSHPR